MPDTEIHLLTEADFEAFAVIVANAYPSAQDSPAERQRMREQWMSQSADPTVHLYGAFRNDLLLGGMQLYDYTMAFGTLNAADAAEAHHSSSSSSSAAAHTIQVPVGGVGMVAVDLLHKKEQVARDLIAFFLDYLRAREAPLALLYPFRPDFYKQMGFGYATKMNEYRFRPAALPTSGSKKHLVALGPDDSHLLLDYYNRYQARTHGMLRRTTFEIARKFANPQSHLIGYRQDGRLHGYLQYRFRSASERNFLLNDLEVVECLYDTPEVLAALLKFLRTQADQIRTIVFWTQEEDLQYLFLDPRDGSDYLMPHVYHASNLQGVGLMYRVVDAAHLLRMLGEQGYRFSDQTCSVTIRLTDTFLPANDSSVLVQFDNGRIQFVELAAPDAERSNKEPEIAIHLDVADFSSLVMGVVSFKTLYMYGLVSLSDPTKVDLVDRLFHLDAKPRCVTAF